ncbi:hypothetical protein L2E82_49631 [Cichorium intybus]|uniref:Uncharacterized protein n=1 Tax=Cichorium intybus TaxID=13427 RepID=A0ACB8YZZ3_CICIN|nr:hypothetical protein L2E82_49631 [Cichorium intybus]
MEEDHKTQSPSFRDRRRKSTLKISCFNRHSDSHIHSSTPSPTLKKSPSTWFRSKLRLNDLAALLDQNPGDGGKHCRYRSSGGTIINRHRRHSTTEFNYDPISYSLNFEDDRLHTTNFLSRLPLSPPGTKNLDVPSPRIEAIEIARTDRDG